MDNLINTNNILGTTLFSPERLTVARQRRKMTMKALAEAVGVSSMMITRIEKGDMEPDDDLAKSLAVAVRMPVTFLYGNEWDEIDVEAVSFRSRRNMTATVRDRTRATGSIASSTLSPEFHRRFTMPPVDVPDLSEYQDSPSTAARLLRNHWKLGIKPIADMVRLMEAKGIEIFWIAEDSPSVDAVSFWRDRRPFMLMNSMNQAGDRSRYNAAHELAHFVLHRHVAVRDGFEIEKQADTFASAFLLPGEQFYYDCPKSLVLSNFFPLKKIWGVSIQAMIRRGKDLGVFREYQYERAFKEMSYLGWRTNEPVEIPCEESTLHKRLYDSLWEDNITPEDFSEIVHLNYAEDLLEMSPVARRYSESGRAEKDSGEICEHNSRIPVGIKSFPASRTPQIYSRFRK